MHFMKNILWVFLTLIVDCIVLTQAYAQFIQHGNKLVGTGAVGESLQGVSVSISSDGTTVILGAPFDNNYVGAAWVFTNTNGVWNQQGTKLVGMGAVGNAFQGHSVSLSSDGSTALVGGRSDNSNKGAAWVFTRTGDVWSQQGSKLVGTGATGNSLQGSSVSLSSDGNTALVGGSYDSNGRGAAWVFTRTGEVWSQQGSKLVGTGAVGQSLQGASGSISSDGNTIIVGGYLDNESAGAAWVFTRTGDVWSQQGSKLVGTGANGDNLRQGYSVSLSSDGNTGVVGGPNDGNFVGAVWVFTRSGGLWSQQGPKLVGTGAVGQSTQGVSVSISSDGNTIIVGGPYDNHWGGAAWVFTRTGDVWNQQGSKLVGTGAVGDAQQGVSVSLSSDAGIAIVCGHEDNGRRGAAWVFTQGGTLVEELVVDIPQQFRLAQNYPNPFNPSTTINYQLPISSFVTIKVFDVLGREVTSLVNEQKSPGHHKAEWNTQGVASGVYIYRLEAGSFIESRKMILLR